MLVVKAIEMKQRGKQSGFYYLEKKEGRYIVYLPNPKPFYLSLPSLVLTRPKDQPRGGSLVDERILAGKSA